MYYVTIKSNMKMSCEHKMSNTLKWVTDECSWMSTRSHSPDNSLTSLDAKINRNDVIVLCAILRIRR